MHSRTLAVLLYGAVAWTLPSVAAEKPGAGPADAAAPAPDVKYESVFTGYLPFREEKLASWRDLNDEVARVGGHIRMFGGAGHTGHGGAQPGPAKPGPGQPATVKEQPAGQPPIRGTSREPQAGHQGH